MKKMTNEWMIYRTRFLIKAKQLTQPLTFVDALGREHSGKKGDYLVESSDGTRSITSRAIFEDVYVAMGLAGNPAPARKLPRRDLDQWIYPSADESGNSTCGKRAS